MILSIALVVGWTSSSLNLPWYSLEFPTFLGLVLLGSPLTAYLSAKLFGTFTRNGHVRQAHEIKLWLAAGWLRCESDPDQQRQRSYRLDQFVSAERSQTFLMKMAGVEQLTLWFSGSSVPPLVLIGLEEADALLQSLQ